MIACRVRFNQYRFTPGDDIREVCGLLRAKSPVQDAENRLGRVRDDGVAPRGSGDKNGRPSLSKTIVGNIEDRGRLDAAIALAEDTRPSVVRRKNRSSHCSGKSVGHAQRTKGRADRCRHGNCIAVAVDDGEVVVPAALRDRSLLNRDAASLAPANDSGSP